jgi:outer membrane protein TolC
MRRALVLAFAMVLVGGSAAAQGPADAGAAGAPGTARAPADSASLASPASPVNPPSIDDPHDPQLAPPPPPPRTLASWDEALQMVRAQSPDYETTIDAVLRAQAQARVVLAAILPMATAQGTFTHQFMTVPLVLEPGAPAQAYPPQDVWGVTGTLSWAAIDPHGIHAYGTARKAITAYEADLADKRRTIAQAVVTAMLATLAAENVAELNRVGLRASLERLALAKVKTRIGGGTELDVDRASQDVAAARSVVITGDESLRQTRESLGLALGSKVAIAAPGDLDLDHFEQTVASTCRLNENLERRADVIAARRRVEVADRTVDDVWLQFAPNFAIGSVLAWTSEPVYPPATTWALEGMLNVPIWDGGARYGWLRDARAAADQARQALEAIRLNEVVQVEQAERAVGVTRASRDVAQQQRDLAAKVDERTRQGYLHGLGTSLDLVISAQALRQAEIDLVLLKFQTAQARVLAVLANADCAY